MLNKKYRLCKRKQFNYIYKKGRHAGCDILSLVYIFAKMPYNSPSHLKIGFSANKKVGGSVQRHRALRKMREAVRPLIPNMAANHNYIFVAKETILDKSVAEIHAAVASVLKKAGLLK